MRVALALVCVLIACSTAPAQRASSDAVWMFVESIAWQAESPDAETGVGSVVALDSSHHFMKLMAKLRRAKAASVVSIDTKDGHVVHVGTWAPANADVIAVTSRLVEFDRIIPAGDESPGGPSTKTWTMLGPPMGPLRRTLRIGDAQFEYVERVGNGDRVLEYWSFFVLKGAAATAK
jgi:hypothetical protein